ncbi:hypothetical protein CDAR_582571 [Caerostris darwini]|uniref:Uncharacterized protein n=1 Tax=Caerostris darwini TaxID=1538125 RepID=A0AAV4PJM1_9ARAC|nr:hypothetical protein CDAR_582571 [Caerostris darwini]
MQIPQGLCKCQLNRESSVNSKNPFFHNQGLQKENAYVPNLHLQFSPVNRLSRRLQHNYSDNLDNCLLRSPEERRGHY